MNKLTGILIILTISLTACGGGDPEPSQESSQETEIHAVEISPQSPQLLQPFQAPEIIRNYPPQKSNNPVKCVDPLTCQ